MYCSEVNLKKDGQSVKNKEVIKTQNTSKQQAFNISNTEALITFTSFVFLLPPSSAILLLFYSRLTVWRVLLSYNGRAFSQSVNTQHLAVTALISWADRCLWVDVHNGGGSLTSKSNIRTVFIKHRCGWKKKIKPLRILTYTIKWSHIWQRLLHVREGQMSCHGKETIRPVSYTGKSFVQQGNLDKFPANLQERSEQEVWRELLGSENPCKYLVLTNIHVTFDETNKIPCCKYLDE